MVRFKCAQLHPFDPLVFVSMHLNDLLPLFPDTTWSQFPSVFPELRTIPPGQEGSALLAALSLPQVWERTPHPRDGLRTVVSLTESTMTTVGRDCMCLAKTVTDGAVFAFFSSRRWTGSPWGVNAYYSVPDHVVVFPAGLLQPPFFHPGYPRYGPFSEGESFGGGLKRNSQVSGWMRLEVGKWG